MTVNFVVMFDTIDSNIFPSSIRHFYGFYGLRLNLHLEFAYHNLDIHIWLLGV